MTPSQVNDSNGLASSTNTWATGRSMEGMGHAPVCCGGCTVWWGNGCVVVYYCVVWRRMYVVQYVRRSVRRVIKFGGT